MSNRDRHWSEYESGARTIFNPGLSVREKIKRAVLRTIELNGPQNLEQEIKLVVGGLVGAGALGGMGLDRAQRYAQAVWKGWTAKHSNNEPLKVKEDPPRKRQHPTSTETPAKIQKNDVKLMDQEKKKEWGIAQPFKDIKTIGIEPSGNSIKFQDTKNFVGKNLRIGSKSLLYLRSNQTTNGYYR